MTDLLWWLGGLTICFVWAVALMNEWQANNERDRREQAAIEKWVRDSEERWG